MSTQEESIQEFHRGLVKLHTPAIVYIVLCMLVGLCGNALVIYFYGFKTKVTPTFMLIVTMAVYDVISCLALMPIQLYQLLQGHTQSSQSFCLGSVFLTYFLSLGSATSLLGIAIDRYRKISKPFGKQISIKVCRYMILFNIILSGILSAPTLAIHRVEVQKLYIIGQNFTAHGCGLRTDEEYRNYIISFQFIILVLCIIAFVILIFSYVSIRKRLLKRPNLKLRGVPTKTPTRKQSEKGKQENRDEGDSNAENSGSKDKTTTKHSNTAAVDKTVETRTVETVNTECSDKPTEDAKPREDATPNCEDTEARNSDTRGGAASNKGQTKQPNNITRKYTIVMLIITVAFFVSYLPCIVLVVAAIIFGTSWITSCTAGYATFALGVRSFLVSSACNPIIYGFFNTEFRKFIHSFLCRFCKCRKQ